MINARIEDPKPQTRTVRNRERRSSRPLGPSSVMPRGDSRKAVSMIGILSTSPPVRRGTTSCRVPRALRTIPNQKTPPQAVGTSASRDQHDLVSKRPRRPFPAKLCPFSRLHMVLPEPGIRATTRRPNPIDLERFIAVVSNRRLELTIFPSVGRSQVDFMADDLEPWQAPIRGRLESVMPDGHRTSQQEHGGRNKP